MSCFEGGVVMKCPECEKDMEDTLEGLGLGKPAMLGNVLTGEEARPVPVYYCAKCHLLVADQTEESE